VTSETISNGWNPYKKDLPDQQVISLQKEEEHDDVPELSRFEVVLGEKPDFEEEELDEDEALVEVDPIRNVFLEYEIIHEEENKDERQK
jgi:hypothetical protein